MLWMRYWDSRAAFLKLGWKINTALYNSVGFSWFLSSKPEAYLQLHYFQIKVEFMSESTPKDEWVHGVLLASAPPLPIPQNPLSKVQWSSKLLFLSPCPLFFFCPVLVFVVFFLVLGGIRVPSESLFVERDDHLRTLHVGLLCRHQVSFIWVFPAKTEKTTQKLIQHLARADTFEFPHNTGSYTATDIPVFNSCPAFTMHTNHFMRNMSSPVESVAPIIRSGARPRAKPLSFSVWGSNGKMQRQSSSKQHLCINANHLQYVQVHIWGTKTRGFGETAVTESVRLKMSCFWG